MVRQNERPPLVGRPVNGSWRASGYVISYERSTPVFDAAELALVRQASTDQSIWLFSSSEAVNNLRMLAGLDSGLNWSNAKAIATHPRIAQAARDAGFGVVYESRPLLNDVVASIESMP